MLDLDRDPVPGDPYEVKELARKLGDFADDVSSALRSVRGLSGDNAVQDWAGLAADAYREQFGDLPGELTKLEKSYRLASRALEAYWPKLETAQADADRALSQGRAARQDLDAARTTQTNANDWVKRAGDKSKEYQADPKPGVEPPSADEVRAATRNALDASNAQKSANTAVHDAQQRLDAAKELAAQAAHLRDTAAGTAEHALHEASDAGIKNKHWWEKAVDWVGDHWDDIVAVCKVIVAVLGIVVMIIGGPLAWIVLAAALVVLADTLIKYAQGKASLWDVLFAALDCIPAFKGLTTAGGLLKLLKNGPKMMRAMGSHLGDVAGMLKGLRSLGERGLDGLKGLRGSVDNALERAKTMAGKCKGGDPIDLVTGEMLMSATDVRLPGLLPLTIERHHVSGLRVGRWFGPAWMSTLDERLEIDDNGAVFAAADGTLLLYPVPAPNGEVLPVEGPGWPLVWDGEAGGELRITDPATGRSRHFTPLTTAGRLSPVLPLRALSDRNGHRITMERAQDGTPVSVRHSGGYHVAVETTEGRITALRAMTHGSAGGTGTGAESTPSEENISGTLLRAYVYNPAGDLTQVINGSGAAQRLEYDVRGRIEQWMDRNNHWYRFRYDDQNRCVEGIGDNGYLDCTISYDATARTTAYTDSLGHTTTYHHDDAFQITAITDPLGHVLRLESGRDNRLLARTDAEGRTTRYDYDARGNPIAITSPDGTTSIAEYNDLGLPVLTSDAEGNRWTYRYDERGNRVEVVDPLGGTNVLTYHDSGALATITDPLGGLTTTEADPYGLLSTATDPQGGTTRHVRDALGRVVAVTDTLGATTTITWTTDGKPARRTFPDGSAESWTWDAEGNLLTHTGATGGVTTFEYTTFDRLAARTEPDGSRREFRYDTELRLVAVTNATGLTWTYTLDPVGRIVAETDYNGRTSHYTFNTTGELTSRTNGAGQTVSYRLDAAGRIAEKNDGRTVTTFAYDANGQLVRAVSPDCVLELGYDPIGRVAAETVNGSATSYTYDALGRRTGRTTPSGARSVWEYTPVGLPSRLLSGGTVIDFTHDSAGREISRTVDRRLRFSNEWDDRGRLRSLTLDVTEPAPGAAPAGGRTVLRRGYGYAADGELKHLEDSLTGPRSFELDRGGRVTAVRGADWTERYAYDDAGNLASMSLPGDDPAQEPVEQTYSGNRRIVSPRVSYEYDGQGRVVRAVRRTLSGRRRTWLYRWDADDRLTGVTTPDDVSWRYAYDPMGRRISKVRLDADGRVVERAGFTWDGDRVAEYTAADGATTTWDYAPGTFRPIAQTQRAALRDAPQEEIDRRFHAIVTDLMGGATELVTPDGRVEWSLRSTLWGWEPGAADAGPEQAGCLLRFAGQFHDEETGLHYNLHRYYDPRGVTYLTPDPLGLSAAPDHYAFVRNPHSWADPQGLQSCPQFLGIQWMTDKMLKRVSFQYQRFVTHTDYEQVWKLGDRKIHVDGGPDANGFMVESKWTGNENQWASSQYNPAHTHYDESKITSQAEKLLDLNDALGGNGLRYAISSPQGAAHFTELLSGKFPEHFADGRLKIFHVPAIGMNR